MRKLVLVGLIAASMAAPVRAHDWVAPLIIGGVIGAVITNQSRPTYIHVPPPPPPPPPVVYYPGTVYPTYTYRPMYKMVDVYIPECNCYRSVPVQIN